MGMKIKQLLFLFKKLWLKSVCERVVVYSDDRGWNLLL